jgi:hypothetical protein
VLLELLELVPSFAVLELDELLLELDVLEDELELLLELELCELEETPPKHVAEVHTGTGDEL